MPFARIEGDAVIPGAQDHVAVLVHHAHVHAVASGVFFKTVLNDIACHLFHGQAGQISPPGVYAPVHTEALYLLGNPDNALHAAHAQVHALALRDAEPVRDDHEFLHVPRKPSVLQPGVAYDDQRRDDPVEHVGDIYAVHADVPDQESGKARHADYAVQQAQQMYQPGFAGGLPVAGEVHADDAQGHAQRQDAQAPHRHHIYGSGTLTVEQRRHGPGAEDDRRGDGAHERDKPPEHDAHDVRQSLPVFLTDAYADHHAGNGQHTARQGPENAQKVVRRGKSRDGHAPHEGLQQTVRDQAAARLIYVAERPGQPDAEYLAALFPGEAGGGKAEVGSPGDVKLCLNAHEHPHPQRGSQREAKGLHAQLPDEKPVERDVDRDIDKACRKCPPSPVFQRKKGGKRIAEHERKDPDGLTQKIAVEDGTDCLILRNESGQAEQCHRYKQYGKDESDQPRDRQVQGEHALHPVLFVPAHVLPAQDHGAAHQIGADSGDQHIERAVKPDRAHGGDPDIIAGEETGHDAVHGAHCSQKDLHRQQPEQQFRDRFCVCRLNHKTDLPIDNRTARVCSDAYMIIPRLPKIRKHDPGS